MNNAGLFWNKDGLFQNNRHLLLIVSVEVSDVGNEVFLDAVLTVSTTDAALLDTCMEALHGLEVFAVDVGLAKLEFAGSRATRVAVSRSLVKTLEARPYSQSLAHWMAWSMVSYSTSGITGPKVSSWMMSMS